MYGFDNRFIEEMDVGDQCSNVVFDASVRYNNYRGRIRWSPKCNFIQFFDILFNTEQIRVERKMFWK